MAPCLSLCGVYASLKRPRSMSPRYSLGISSGPGRWAGCGGGRGRKINTRTEGWGATGLSIRWVFSGKILLSQCRQQAPSCTENPFLGPLPINNQFCFSLTSTSPTQPPSHFGLMVYPCPGSVFSICLFHKSKLILRIVVSFASVPLSGF